MRRLSALVLGSVSWLAFCTPVATQTFPTGKLWIVSTSGCPNVHFTTIGAAVSAASSGDVILVRPGSYPGFVISQKALAIVGDGRGLVMITSPTTVTYLRTTQSVLLQGMLFNADLSLSGNQGPILVEDCTTTTLSTLTVAGCDNAVLTRIATSALKVTQSRMTGYELGVGAGLKTESSTVLLVGSTVVGAPGPNGFTNPFPLPCTNGGPGFPGIESSSSVFLLSTTVSGGPGGAGGTSYYGPCRPGPAGPPFSGSTPTILSSTAPVRTYSSQSPVLEGTSPFVTFRGEANDTAVLAFSFSQEQRMLTPFGGTLVPQLPGGSQELGSLPAAGLSGNVFIPTGLVAPGTAAVLFGQGLFLDVPPTVTQQVIYIGSTHAWVILDQTHDPRDGCP
jgi:hypothetical protein